MHIFGSAPSATFDRRKESGCRGYLFREHQGFCHASGSGSTQVVAEAAWSFNLSATFTPDGVFESHWGGVQQIISQPVVPGTVFGTTPTDQPVEPRDQSGNAYILNSSHWSANGNNQNDYAHQHPYPIP